MAKTFTALTATRETDNVVRRLETLTTDDLPTDGVLVDVHYSSVNYKDGLATIPGGQVASISPLVPGIDLAGEVVSSSDDRFHVGDLVLAHGYGLGTARHGGYAGQARVPAEWLVHLPAGLSLREAMLIGTAGFTAAMSVAALQDHGIGPDSGPIVVTGASGGVGSCAVDILAGLGYSVTATTGKSDAETFLRALGASEVLGRERFADPQGKPLRRPSSRRAPSTASVGTHWRTCCQSWTCAAWWRPAASLAAPACRRRCCRSSCAVSRWSRVDSVQLKSHGARKSGPGSQGT